MIENVNLHCMFFVEGIYSGSGFWADNRRDYQYYKKCFALIKVSQCFTDFQPPGFSNYNHMKIYWNEFLIILGIWSLLNYFVFSFLSSFLLLPKEVDYSPEVKLISPCILCFYKWRHHINVALHTLPTYFFFYQTLPTFCWQKVKQLKALMRSTNKANNSFWGSRQV